MRLEKRLIRAGDGVTFPSAGSLVTVDYVLWLYSAGQPEGKGQE